MVKKIIDNHEVSLEWVEVIDNYEIYVDGIFVGSASTTKEATSVAKDYIKKNLGNQKIKIVLEQGAYEPTRGHPTDAGLDLKSPIDIWVHPGEYAKIDTKVRMAIPDGYVGLITSKSGLMLKNITSRGTIDSSYRGTISAVLYNHGREGYLVHAGDKVCQIVIIPIVIPDIEYVDTLDETERGEGGFGSTGV